MEVGTGMGMELCIRIGMMMGMGLDMVQGMQHGAALRKEARAVH